MAGNGGFGDDRLAPGSYPELLFDDEITGLATGYGFVLTSSFSISDGNNDSPEMLRFGDYAKQCDPRVIGTGQKSGSISTDSSVNNIDTATLPKPGKKRDGSGRESVKNGGAQSRSQSTSKKPKSEHSSVTGHAKVFKKEKLGERIMLLQQLVSPFGKTDTASVLHEALGYIRFLQDQVQVLCSPYLPRLPAMLHSPDINGEKIQSEKIKDDLNLRSRGLCLVPVELTLHVADSNGADLWSSPKQC